MILNESASPMGTPAQEDAAPITIVLEHGTWARGAAWTREDSKLCQRLRADVGAPVRFCPYTWSGGNSHADRLDAAVGLGTRLRELAEACPSEKRFIVGHSHGGNVACYALRDGRIRTSVTGVVCLATPFVHVESRALSNELRMLVATVAVMTALLVPCRSWSLATGDPGVVGGAIGLFLLLGLVFGSIVWAVLRGWASDCTGRNLPYRRRVAADLKSALAFPPIEPTRLLVVRGVSDEATAALVTAQFGA